MTREVSVPRVLVPRAPVRSKAGRALGWIALPWAIGFAVAVDAALDAVGWPRNARPPLVQVAIVLVGLAPVIIWFLAGWLGRRRRFAWLLESPQPTLILDADGLTLLSKLRGPQRIRWSDITAVRIQYPTMPSRILGHGGATLAEIPGPLATPRVEGGGETRLADELAAFSPRLAGVDKKRREDRLVTGVVLAVLAGLGAIGLIVLLNR